MYNWGVLAYERVVGKVGSALSFYSGSLRQRVYLLLGQGFFCAFWDGGFVLLGRGGFALFGMGVSSVLLIKFIKALCGQKIVCILFLNKAIKTIIISRLTSSSVRFSCLAT